MTVVGFDTATAATSACVLEAGGTAFEFPPPGQAPGGGSPRHSAELMPELERLLAAAGRGWQDVEAVCVGIGPGTFTGLRIGVATARALGQALDVPLKPVSSLAAVGLALACEDAGRPLLAVIDAKRREVFAALYRAVPRAGAVPGLVAVWPEECLAPAALAERIERGLAAGELERPPLAAGDGSIQFRDRLEAAGVELPPAVSGLHAPRALMACRLAERAPGVEPGQVTPNYLRLPDAEISLRKRTLT